MEELKLTGNHLKGSRPILTFSSNFDKSPHWQLLKEMITQVCLPKRMPLFYACSVFVGDCRIRHGIRKLA